VHVPLRAEHRAPVLDLLRRTAEFRPDEVDVALELVDDALGGGADYRFVVDEGEGGALLGYACFGATPMTEGTFDLYWIVVEPGSKRAGIGRRLLERVEADLRLAGARLLRVETEGGDAYAATRGFYERVGYEVLATIRDFYAIGRDLVVFGRYL
jgi:ribosomal protein S18 acetylase RimI-like enzyme